MQGKNRLLRELLQQYKKEITGWEEGKRAVVSGGQMLVTPQRDSHGELEMARERKMGAGLTPRRLQPGRSRTPPQRDEYPEQELCRWAAPQHRQ